MFFKVKYKACMIGWKKSTQQKQGHSQNFKIELMKEALTTNLFL